MVDNIKKRRQRIQARIERQKLKVKDMMTTAPFQRLADKFFFVMGAVIVVGYGYVIGKYPNDFYYRFYTCVMAMLLIARMVHFVNCGWKYFLIDFCYFANTVILFMINFDPKNEQLFKTGFIFANGILGYSTYQFRNSLVFHKIDMITDLGIHMVPVTAMYHIKWVTMLEQSDLPPEQQRFSALKSNEGITEYLLTMWVIPTATYLVWSASYSFINFVFKAKKIKRNNIQTLYRQFEAMPAIQNYLKSKNLEMRPWVFMLGHFTLFQVTSLLALISYHCMWFNVILMVTYLTVSAWNGANYYMEYFSKRYEKTLQQLQELHDQAAEAETSKKD